MPGSQAKEHAASVYPWRRHAEHRRPERTFGAQRQGQPIYASPSPSRAAGFSSIADQFRYRTDGFTVRTHLDHAVNGS